jgi:cytochrome c-type biogenesis protein CcmH
MKRSLLSILGSLLLVVCAHAIDSAPAFDDPILQARYQKLTQELRCLVCQNETIADSNVQLAGDLRRELRGLLAAGKSDEEVLKFLTDRYGDFVLYRPPFIARTWVLWATPIVALLGACAIAFVIIKRRAQLPLDDDPEAGTKAQ